MDRKDVAAKISEARRAKSVLPIGHTENYLTVVSLPIFRPRNAGKGNVKVRRHYLCRCVCGVEKEIDAYAVASGSIKSCGCKWRELLAKGRYKHGGHRGKNNGGAERLYMRWCGMKDRCNSPSSTRYDDYGGRGIRVCDEWVSDYSAFRTWALANGFQDYLEIDRIDNDGPYSPDNCRFVTHKNNVLNTRRSRLVTAFGETKTVTEWVRDARCQSKCKTITMRIDSLGWPPEKAITTPVKQTTRRSTLEPEYYI